MKYNPLIPGIGSLVLLSCASFNPQQAISSATGIAQIALTAYGQYQQAKTGHTDPATVVNQASADLSGIAALAQASIGKTPAAANLAQGAANPVPASDIVALLPSKPITQATVDSLFQAAAQVKQP